MGSVLRSSAANAVEKNPFRAASLRLFPGSRFVRIPEMGFLVVDQVLRLSSDEEADDDQNQDKHTHAGVECGGFQLAGQIGRHENRGEEDLHDKQRYVAIRSGLGSCPAPCVGRDQGGKPR